MSDHVVIEFEVQDATLKEARRAAELKLAKFLGPDDDPNDWAISMRCSPMTNTMTGSTLLWEVQVTAVANLR